MGPAASLRHAPTWIRVQQIQRLASMALVVMASCVSAYSVAWFVAKEATA